MGGDKKGAESGKGKDADKGKFVDLPGLDEGKVVVRFPPEASGFLHVGHAKAALLNQYYQTTFKGKLIMRFDDTNPAKECAVFEKVILEDLKLLEIKPDIFSHSSDHFDTIMGMCEQLIKEGKAYADDTDGDTMKTEREARTESKNRANPPAKNLAMWEEMKKGSDAGQKCSIRIKMDMQSNNGALRDPVIFRCKPEPHVRTGTKYKAYPTYDFTCPIVDSVEGVTHALRTTEYLDRDEQYYFICDVLGLRRPFLHAYSRLNLMNTVMSKRKLTKLVDAGLVEGWDDPRFPTVQGVRRRGMTVEGLRTFIVAQGSSRTVNHMDWNKIWATNKQAIDPVAPRYTALRKDSLVAVKVSGAGSFESRPVALHPKNAGVGEKAVWFGPTVWVEADDAAEMSAGQSVTFVNWGNLRITKVDLAAKEVTADLDLDNKDYKKTMKVTWLASPESPALVPVVATHFDHLITKPILGKEENWEDYIATHSKFTFELLGEPAIKDLKKGDIIQLQRKGYYIVDSPFVAASEFSGAALPLVLFDIPDGHNKSSGTALAAPAAKAASSKSASGPAKGLEGRGGMSAGDEILLSIQAVGGKIRDLKAAKADKAAIESEVKALLELKKKFKDVSGTEWNAKLVEAVAEPKPAGTGASNGCLSAGDQILLDIKAAGEKVRDLKGAKAGKADIDAAVKVLLDLKASFKTATGKDWNPKLVDEIKPPAAEAPSAPSNGDGILLAISAAGEKVRDLKGAKAAKPDIDAAVKTLLDLKASFKTTTGKDWNPKLVDEIKAQAPAATAAPSATCGASNGDSILLAVKAAGEKVRDLKSAKAAKADIDAAVKSLLDLKASFKTATGKDWNPKLVDEIKSQTTSVAAPPTSKGSSSNGDDILLAIKAAGEKVRDLKSAKAPKADIDGAVKALLDLKASFKAATGKDWNPKLVDAIAPPAAAAAPQTAAASTAGAPGYAILLAIKAAGDNVRTLKAAKADKATLEAEVGKLLSLKDEFKSVTGKTWKPDLVNALPAATTAQPAKTAPAPKAKQASPAPKAASSSAGSSGDHRDLLTRIQAAGDKTRKLKMDKADKSSIDAAVAELLRLKADFKAASGSDWNPNLLGEAGAAPSTAVAADPAADAVTEQGARVRSLKDAKAPKDQVDAAVAKLLELKAAYKAATGKDYAAPPGAGPARGGGGGGKKGGGGGGKKEPKPKQATPEPSGGGKQTKLGLAFKKEESFAEWYSELITKAEMIEYYDVSGCYVLRPWSFAIWEVITRWFDDEIKKLGISNLYFPMFVSQAALQKEKDHIADFSPEVAWVTRSGDSEMAEPIAIRPTSETVMYPTFARWVQSHRDLPIRINQWCNVVRWEFKHPTPFLRTREFLWQEGHTAFATKEPAEAEVLDILDLYARVYEELLAVPVVKGRKTDKEKFAGGDFTTTVEAYIPANGRGIQGATSHHLGQNFSRMFDISFEDPNNEKEKLFAWQNSWGITTRTIGVAAMVHGDNAGLVLPPRVAKIQVMIVACGLTAALSAADKATLYAHCDGLAADLCDAGVRAEADLRENYSPGWKFNHWELKGVPIRVEVGPRDLAKAEFVAVRRDDGSKATYKAADAVETLAALLVTIHDALFNKAKAVMDAHILVTESWERFVAALDEKHFIQAPFCGRGPCEERIKAESAKEEAGDDGAPAMGAKSLCIPFRQPKDLKPGQACVHPACGQPATSYTMFGRSY